MGEIVKEALAEKPEETPPNRLSRRRQGTRPAAGVSIRCRPDALCGRRKTGGSQKAQAGHSAPGVGGGFKPGMGGLGGKGTPWRREISSCARIRSICCSGARAG